MAHKDWTKSFFVRLSSNLRAQRLLERGVLYAQSLMGIGAGGASDWSGEVVLSDLLQRAYSEASGPLSVFDVGANRGQFLATVLDPLRASGLPLQVHAFEPSREAFRLLSERFKDRPDIRLNNFGLGNRTGEFDLFANSQGSALSSLSPRRLDHFGVDFKYSERVQIRLLDDYCSQEGIRRIDLLKLDVEGHELDVLQGATRMFGEHRVRMVSFEFGGTHIDSRTYFQDFWYFFREHGPADIHRLTPTGLLVPLSEYREELEQFRATNFVVLLPAA